MAKQTVHHSVSSRTNAQTSRPGWRPRQGSPAQLARDIAASIRQHRAAGRPAAIANYTTNPITIALVEQELSGPQPLRPVQSEADQATRREQQAWLESLRVKEPAPITPCEDCGRPTTYTRLCTACQDQRYLWHRWQDEEQYAWEQAHGCC